MLTGNVQVSCQRSTTGGKGNRGKYVDRSKRICAAGIPTAQGDDDIKSCFQHYLLKEEVDALMNDAIIPPAPPRPLAPIRHPPEPDMRHSCVSSELATLVNPPVLTRFQTLVNNIKDTSYKSYWKKQLGTVPDPIPMFPKGYDIENTTYGKKRPDEGTLYDLIMPKEPLPDMTPKSKEPAAQTDRKYCRPAFNPDLTYGYRTNIDKRGIYMKCNLRDAKVIEGTAERVPLSSIQVEMQTKRTPTIGKVLAPNNNISNVPKGYTFGIMTRPENLPECLSTCTINPKSSLLRKCLSHLNTLRKVMSTRFLPTFFNKFYLLLKYEDKDKTGWIPKEIVYNNCAKHRIRFDPSLIESLLCAWQAFDGSNIEYKTFTHILNFKQPLPDLPKIPDIHPDCLDFRTTYSEMVKPGQPRDERRAGTPSGRYLDLDYPITPDYDNYCSAHRTCLPEESDVHSCLKPSIFTLMHVSHRDMYAKREPDMVRQVFEAAGEVFTDERFNQVWEEAKKHHSEGWVCYETFKRALELFPPLTEADKTAGK